MNTIIYTIRYTHLCNLNVIITTVIIHVYVPRSFLGVRTILMQFILFAWFNNQFSTSSRISTKIQIKVYTYNLEWHMVMWPRRWLQYVLPKSLFALRSALLGSFCSSLWGLHLYDAYLQSVYPKFHINDYQVKFIPTGIKKFIYLNFCKNHLTYIILPTFTT
jgi:hypothetical protein